MNQNYQNQSLASTGRVMRTEVGGVIPLTTMPEQRADARPAFPIYSSIEIEKMGKWARKLPDRFPGRTGALVKAVWGLSVDKWLAGIASTARHLEREVDTVTLRHNFSNAQAEVAEEIESKGFAVPVSSAGIVDGSLDIVLSEASEKAKADFAARTPKHPVEKVGTWIAKLLFVLPQLLFFMTNFPSLRIDPSHSILAMFFVAICDFGLMWTYQSFARAVFANKDRWVGGGFLVGYFTVVTCAVILDATVFVKGSAHDIFGQPNPDSVPFLTAVFIAVTCSGLLAFTGLANAKRDQDQVDDNFAVDEQVKNLRVALAPKAKQLRIAESELRIETAREAEIMATAHHAWVTFLKALCFMAMPVETVSDEALAFYLTHGSWLTKPCATTPSTNRTAFLDAMKGHFRSILSRSKG